MDQIYLALSSFPLLMLWSSVMNYWPSIRLLNTGSCTQPSPEGALVFTRLCCTHSGGLVQCPRVVKNRTQKKGGGFFPEAKLMSP